MCSLAREITRLIDENYVGDLIFLCRNNVAIDLRFFLMYWYDCNNLVINDPLEQPFLTKNLISRLATIIRNSFIHKNGNRRYKFLVLGHEGPYFVKEHSDSKNSSTLKMTSLTC